MKNIQSFRIITEINMAVKVEIEGVGIVSQLQIAQKLFDAGIINWKCRNESGRIALSNNLIDIAINKLELYPKQF